MNLKDSVIHFVVIVAFAVPAAFVKQCSKNADLAGIKPKFDSYNADWDINSSRNSDYDFYKVNWINPNDIPYPSKENDVKVTYGEDFVSIDTRVSSSVQVLSLLPDTPLKFESIFSKSPSVSDVKDTEIALNRLNAMNINGIKLTPNSHQELLDEIVSSDEKIVIIVGHNEKGFLKFGDGSTLKLFDINLTCENSGKQCVFISCKSKSFLEEKDLGLDYNIILSDSVLLVRELVKKIQKYDTISPEEINDYFVESVKQIRFYNGSKVMIKIGAPFGASLIVYEVSVQNLFGDDVISYADLLLSRISDIEDSNNQLRAYSDFISKYEGSNSLELQQLVLSANIEQAQTLSELGRFGDAHSVIDRLVSKYQHPKLISEKIVLTELFFVKADMFSAEKKFELAIVEFDKLISKYHHSKDDNMQDIVAKAIFKKASTFQKMGAFNDEIANYDSIINSFGSSDVIKHQYYSAKALYRKAMRLTKQGNFKDSLDTYDFLIHKYRTLAENFMRTDDYKPVAERENFVYFNDFKLKDEITEYFLSSQGNAAEISFFIEDTNKSLSRSKIVLSLLSPKDDQTLIYEFFIHVAKNNNHSLSSLCNHINSLNKEPKLHWDFEEIDRLLLEVFDKNRVELKKFILFFKGKIDKDKLRDVCTTH